MNLSAGGRNITLLGRDDQHLRKVVLVSGVKAAIDPSRWVQIQQAKTYDAKSTSILRISKHKFTEDKWLVYGVRAEVPSGESKTKIVEEVYEVVAIEEALRPALVKVAERCGLSDLVDSVK